MQSSSRPLAIHGIATPPVNSPYQQAWAKRRAAAQACQLHVQQQRAPQAIEQAAVNYAVIVERQEIIGGSRQALQNEEMALLANERALCDRVRLVQAGGARAEVADLQSLVDVRTKLHQIRGKLTVNCGASINAADRAGREFGKFGHLIWGLTPIDANQPSRPVSVKEVALPGRPEFSKTLARSQRALKNRGLAVNSGWGKPQVALKDLDVALKERQRWENELLRQLADADPASVPGVLHEQLAEVRRQIATVQSFKSRVECAASEAPVRIHIGPAARPTQ